MSEPFQVNLSRASPGQSWGFRLQGGSDFSTPLSVQSVVPGSLAEHCGLKAGDAVLQIGSRPSDELQHEEAKREIMMSGDNVVMLIQRGSVSIWKPKVTPLAELRGQPGAPPPDVADNYVQKTSLAANKPESMKINFFNKAARPFPGASNNTAPAAPSGGPGGNTVPVIVNAQYNTPMGMYSTNSALEAFDHQSQSLVGSMDGLSVDEKEASESNNNDPMTKSSAEPATSTAPTATTTLLTPAKDQADIRRSPSPTFLAVHGNDPEKKIRSQSPSFLSVQGNLGEKEKTRSVSPTLWAIQQEESQNKNLPSGSAVYKDTKDGEEIRYHGYTNPNKQSRSFRLLQQGLVESEAPSAAPQASQPAMTDNRPSGMRSVRAPTGPPPNVQMQQAQTMTCKVCGRLVTGVFVKVKGEPMCAKCYNCVRCGKSLKNQGFFTIDGQLTCDVCAKSTAQPPGANMTATAVYR